MPDIYDRKKTASKAAPPLVAGIGAELAFFICQRFGCDVPREQLYQLSTVLLSGYYALNNWIKNRKKK